MLGYLLTTNDPEAAAYVEASRELEQHREEIREASSRRLVIFMVQRESGQCVCVPLLAAGPPAIKVRFFRLNRTPSYAARKSSSAEAAYADTPRSSVLLAAGTSVGVRRSITPIRSHWQRLDMAGIL